MFLPCQSIEGHQTGDSIASDLNAAFQPRLPTDVATWDECSLSVDDNKLGVHDTEGEEEQTLHLKADAGLVQQGRIREAELLLPFSRRVGVAIARLWVQ